MYELVVYPRPKDTRLINNSPFCSKSEIFLKLNNLEYKVVDFLGNPGKFSKGKLPVLMDGNNEIADSSFIQKYLEEKHSLKLDEHLSNLDWSNGYAYSRLVEEFLYWAILHERWFIDENWIKMREEYFSHIPGVIRGPISTLIRKGTKKSAIGHGMSRHSDEDIFYHGFNTLRSIAIFLGDKDYFLGEKVSSFDSTIYAFTASALYSPYGPRMRAEAQKYQNLVDYCERMYTELFGT